ncbi:ciliary microtubule inner protein 6 isoform X2 [Pelodiscus sinensis]|uniref:ciliary microtubule inner protein 6 isoform X2 n=1 Tax=Pelodiscus sinensis TaxID=13735 RepID=UPI003F6C315B
MESPPPPPDQRGKTLRPAQQLAWGSPAGRAPAQRVAAPAPPTTGRHGLGLCDACERSQLGSPGHWGPRQSRRARDPLSCPGTMRQIPEDSIRRRKKAPPHQLPDTYRIFNTDMPEVSMRIEKINGECIPQKNKNSFQESYLPEWRNNPQPHYAKLINTNVRFLNEPIYYMETEGTMTKQFHLQLLEHQQAFQKFYRSGPPLFMSTMPENLLMNPFEESDMELLCGQR